MGMSEEQGSFPKLWMKRSKRAGSDVGTLLLDAYASDAAITHHAVDYSPVS